MRTLQRRNADQELASQDVVTNYRKVQVSFRECCILCGEMLSRRRNADQELALYAVVHNYAESRRNADR